MEVHEIDTLLPREVGVDDLRHGEPQTAGEGEAEDQEEEPAVVPAVLPQLSGAPAGEGQAAVHAVELKVVSREPDPSQGGEERHRRQGHQAGDLLGQLVELVTMGRFHDCGAMNQKPCSSLLVGWWLPGSMVALPSCSSLVVRRLLYWLLCSLASFSKFE